MTAICQWATLISNYFLFLSILLAQTTALLPSMCCSSNGFQNHFHQFQTIRSDRLHNHSQLQQQQCLFLQLTCNKPGDLLNSLRSFENAFTPSKGSADFSSTSLEERGLLHSLLPQRNLSSHTVSYLCSIKKAFPN